MVQWFLVFLYVAAILDDDINDRITAWEEMIGQNVGSDIEDDVPIINTDIDETDLTPVQVTFLNLFKP